MTFLTTEYLDELKRAAFDPRSRTRCGEIMLSPLYRRSRNSDDELKTTTDPILLEMIAHTPPRRTDGSVAAENASTVLDRISGMCCQSGSTCALDDAGEISEYPPADRPDPMP